MTKLFIDTEFNGFGGELISMAIVDQYDNQFYEVLEIEKVYDSWVKHHVVPLLEKPPIHHMEFTHRLAMYLEKYDGFTLVADWPDDIRYFCQEIITSPGGMMAIPRFNVEMRRDLDAVRSKVPHNALMDAIAIKESYEVLERQKKTDTE